jgi:Flp pilus assembly protein TadG
MPARRKSRWARQRGQTMALVAISMVSLLAMAALAIDIVTLYTARGQAERAADSAALAAAKVLADSGVTTDPNNASGFWAAACTAAVSQATTIASQNLVAGQPPSSVVVSFPAFNGGPCTGTNATFGINPQVSVQVTVSNLPTFFARIWSRATNSVSAGALAEAYNPSNSSSISSGGTIGPNIVHCLKPLLVPNCDPVHNTGGSYCGANFQAFINPDTSITNPGASPTGVIGETFTLTSACTGSGTCIPQNPGFPYTTASTPPTLAYYPLEVPVSSNACPSCTPAPPTDFETNLACCNSTPVQCGQSYSLDTTDGNPGGAAGATQTAGQCLIHETTAAYPASCTSTLDQDCLDTSTGPPYVMRAGLNNPLKGKTSGPASSLAYGDAISTSDSVVTLAIYDNTVGPAGNNNFPPSPPSTFTIIGFLQVFINDAVPQTSGADLQVTVLNVTGCGSSPTGSPIAGSGPAVPVRLIHP